MFLRAFFTPEETSVLDFNAVQVLVNNNTVDSLDIIVLYVLYRVLLYYS
jgi:hypothetical protein